MPLPGFEYNVWDKDVPIEKSSYIREGAVQFINLDGFKYDRTKLTMLDLFCGAGGFAVGASWAGFQSLVGVDYLEPAMETWTENHPNAIGCLGDIKELDAVELKKLLQNKGVKDINLITGGVPCQGFSRANRKHVDNDERNFLFREYMRFVEVFKPDYIILENVSGMRSTAGGAFEKAIKESMETLGYSVNVRLLNAADYGVPQVRQRLLFVGVKCNAGLASEYVFPDGEFKASHRTVRDAISDLPCLGNNETKDTYDLPPQSEFQKLMRGGSRKIGIRKPSILSNHTAPNHPQETIDKIAQTKPGAPMYAKFKQRIRLQWDAASPTQLAGGIRPQFQFGHPEQSRGLSIRERARIQTFPDAYVFKGGTVQERVQTGNAVPPLLIYNISKPIMEDICRRNNERNAQ